VVSINGLSRRREWAFCTQLDHVLKHQIMRLGDAVLDHHDPTTAHSSTDQETPTAARAHSSARSVIQRSLTAEDLSNGFLAVRTSMRAPPRETMYS
jgi:hypothetical protein